MKYMFDIFQVSNEHNILILFYINNFYNFSIKNFINCRKISL